jgi:hypothetical protein
MSTNNGQQNIEDLRRQLAEAEAAQGGGGSSGASRFTKPKEKAGAALPKELGMLVPLKFDSSKGLVKVFMLYDGDTAARDPEEVIEELIAAGYPVDAWRPKDDGDGRGSFQKRRRH